MRFNIDDVVTITSGPRRGQMARVIGLPLGGKSVTYTLLVKGKGVVMDEIELEKSPDSEGETGPHMGIDSQTTVALG